MTDVTLHDCRILVAEDEYMIADEFCLELEEAGAVVIGPVTTVEDALSSIAAASRIDGAVLDVNLGGTMSFAAADRLMKAGTPFIFTIGYDASSIPDRFNDIARCEKPVSIGKVVRAIGRAMRL
ncbi:response regulator [Roseomonas sp. KE2513]|uniref:response regulator n=1 Tax=Roseomonas sp. KE2513 TaxID=2479202 RepID=UPI0018DFEC62|nr:response regulator [Roseomonas sp. KE2513]MBI0539305.1 response regulator [Roseomonas sp. KE2513]